MKIYSRMIWIIVFVILATSVVVLMLSFSGSEDKNCYSPENFDKTISYAKWKRRTSKIGKVLVNGYRVEVSPENEILFMHDKDDYTIFKVNREKGIILLPVKQKKSLEKKANNAFCELLKYALFHPVNPE